MNNWRWPWRIFITKSSSKGKVRREDIYKNVVDGKSKYYTKVMATVTAYIAGQRERNGNHEYLLTKERYIKQNDDVKNEETNDTNRKIIKILLQT